MNEKKYERKLDIQQKKISYQSKQIEDLESLVQKLKLEIEEKNNVISSIEPMRKELAENIAEVKQYKNEYKSLIQELKKMKEIVNQEVYRGRWKIVRWIINL